MLPSPITSALSTLQAHTVPCLLIGGQACVLYGGAEFSRGLDLVIATESDALPPLRAALADLRAELIAVPPLRLDLLERGHAVHFRCQRADVAHLRIDVLARPPRIADLGGLWARRVMVPIPEGAAVPVIGLPDLVATKKTHWPPRSLNQPLLLSRSRGLVGGGSRAPAVGPPACRFGRCSARSGGRTARRAPAVALGTSPSSSDCAHHRRRPTEALRQVRQGSRPLPTLTLYWATCTIGRPRCTHRRCGQ